MPKISSITTVSVPKLSDKLVGTSVGGTPNNETYNFTLQQLKDLFDGSPIPSNLQQVLDQGNSATEDIFLTGKIHTTDLEVFNEAQFSTVFVSGLLYDSNNSFGTTGQFLISTGTGVEWVTVTDEIPTLQQVLNAGNIANQNITLTGAIQSTSVSATTITASSDLNVNGTLTDGAASNGTSGQVLSSTGGAVVWVNLPTYSAVSPLLYNDVLKQFSIQAATNTQNGYLKATDWINFDGKQNAGNYITNLTGEATASGPGVATITLGTSAVTGKILTGLNITGGSVAATDSILSAFGKVQNQINGLIGGSVFQGTWNASANTPTLTSSVGTQGHYYIVNVAGSTNLNGITDWAVGDWAIFDGTAWQQVDNTDAVVSVNGFTGAVSLTTSNIPESTNLYYLDSRARQAISLTTTGTSGIATYNNVTGVLNIPNYTTDLSGYVPYTGATTDVDLGINSLTADYLEVSTTSIHSADIAQIVWDATDGTFDMGLLNGVTLQAGQELHIYGKASGAIGNGKAVMFAGVQGDHLLLSEADAATINANPQYFVGIATQDFADNDFGYVTSFGKVRGLNTLSYTLGQVLYYDSTSATDGLLTGTMPVAPNAKIEVAAVVRVHATEGILMVRPHTMPKVDNIQDIYSPLGSRVNNSTLGWINANQRFESKTIPELLGYTPADDSLVVHKAGFETITGPKEFDNYASFNYSQLLKVNPTFDTTPASGYLGIRANQVGSTNSIAFWDGTTYNTSKLLFNNLGSYNYTFPSTSGTVALTSDIPSLAGYVPTSRTLTINGVTYDLTTDRSWTIASSSVMNAGSGTCSIVGSGNGNTASGNYSFAGGGSNNTAFCSYTAIGGGANNSAFGNNATVAGGQSNSASGYRSTIGGGGSNQASSTNTTVSGGYSNAAQQPQSFVGGGKQNTASGYVTTVVAGRGNTASGYYSFIGAGKFNCTFAGADYSSVLGGSGNTANAVYAGVFGCNLTNSVACSFKANRFVAENIPSGSAVCADSNNMLVPYTPVTPSSSIIVVGSGTGSTLRCGVSNTASGNYSSALGGFFNTASNYQATIVGGFQNTASGYMSSILGGKKNTASGYHSFVGGGCENKATSCSSSVVGGLFNNACMSYAFVGGGCKNTASNYYSFVGGGFCNISNANSSVVVGGACNIATGYRSTISGGYKNTNCGFSGFIGGGQENTISAYAASCAIIVGGWRNSVNFGAEYGAVLGGQCSSVAACFAGVFGCNLSNNNACTFMANNFVIGDFSNGTYNGCSLALDANGKMCIGSGGGGASVMNSGSGYCSLVGSGRSNTASGYFSAVFSGDQNTASGSYAVVVGGGSQYSSGNSAIGDYSFIGNGGGTFGANTTYGNNSFIGNGLSNLTCSTGSYSFIGNGNSNTVSGQYSVIVGGYGNISCGLQTFVGNGSQNCASGFQAIVVGGCNNSASGYRSFVGGGGGAYSSGNCATGFYSTISGGYKNAATGIGSFIGAGGSGYGGGNTASGDYSSIISGYGNNTNLQFNSHIIGGGLTASSSNTTYTNALSKQSGTFRINHPDPSKTATKYLQHSFVESPTRGDNIYRFSVCAVNCKASVELPDYYKFLNESDQVWISPKNHFGAAYGIIDGTQSTVDITSNADGEYNVLVIGTRKDIDAKNGFLGVEIWK